MLFSKSTHIKSKNCCCCRRRRKGAEKIVQPQRWFPSSSAGIIAEQGIAIVVAGGRRIWNPKDGQTQGEGRGGRKGVRKYSVFPTSPSSYARVCYSSSSSACCCCFFLGGMQPRSASASWRLVIAGRAARFDESKGESDPAFFRGTAEIRSDTITVFISPDAWNVQKKHLEASTLPTAESADGVEWNGVEWNGVEWMRW